MNRRQVLQWMSGAIGTACTAVVAVPGVSYVLATVRKRDVSAAVFRRVAPLAALLPGQPAVMALTGSRSDAWTTYPQELVGRVWLVRQHDESNQPDGVVVRAYTTSCPHLGCETQAERGGQGFFCPCHKAKFGLDGALAGGSQPGARNPAPRPLDSLECRVVKDDASGEPWVEVKYEEFQRGLTKKVPTA